MGYFGRFRLPILWLKDAVDLNETDAFELTKIQDNVWYGAGWFKFLEWLRFSIEFDLIFHL